MLAARMYGIDDVRLEEVPTPTPAAGELLLRVKAAAVCGTDVRMITCGAKGIDGAHPRTLGHEIAGEIARLGAGVTGYRVGQRVAVAPNMGCGICPQCVAGNSHLCPTYQALGINLDGGFAEYCLVPAQAVRAGNVCVLEDNVSYEEGAINEPLSCVCNGFERADIHPGDNVLVIGAGPIGIMHCALALMAGGKVYLNDLSQQRLEAARQLYPAIEPLTGDLTEEVRRVTGGVGMDAIITACPVPAVQSNTTQLAAIGARIIFFGGVPASAGKVPIDTNAIHYKQLIVSGTTRASLTQYRKTLRFISSGVLDARPLVTARLPLSDIAEGIRRTKQGIGLKNVIIME